MYPHKIEDLNTIILHWQSHVILFTTNKRMFEEIFNEADMM